MYKKLFLLISISTTLQIMTLQEPTAETADKIVQRNRKNVIDALDTRNEKKRLRGVAAAQRVYGIDGLRAMILEYQVTSELITERQKDLKKAINANDPLLVARACARLKLYDARIIEPHLRQNSIKDYCESHDNTSLHDDIFLVKVCSRKCRSSLTLDQKNLWNRKHNYILKKLVDNGLDFNAEGTCRSILLHKAVQTICPEAVKMLVKLGACPNARGWHDCTPMHFVVQSDKSDPEMIRALHKLGADVNAKTIKGRTPLHIAAQSENFEQVRMLLGCHADMTIANNDGMIPEQFVKYRPKMKILFKQEKNKRQVEKDIHKQKMRNVFDELKARNNKAS